MLNTKWPISSLKLLLLRRRVLVRQIKSAPAGTAREQTDQLLLVEATRKRRLNPIVTTWAGLSLPSSKETTSLWFHRKSYVIYIGYRIRQIDLTAWIVFKTKSSDWNYTICLKKQKAVFIHELPPVQERLQTTKLILNSQLLNWELCSLFG